MKSSFGVHYRQPSAGIASSLVAVRMFMCVRLASADAFSFLTALNGADGREGCSQPSRRPETAGFSFVSNSSMKINTCVGARINYGCEQNELHLAVLVVDAVCGSCRFSFGKASLLRSSIESVGVEL